LANSFENPLIMMTDLLLGIDGGGSTTRALLADHSGTLLSAGTAGPGNYQATGFDAAALAIQSAIDAAFRNAGIDRASPVAAICLGLAGAGRPEDRARFEAWAARQGLAQRCVVVSDAELVLAAGTPEGWGVALICGTGSIAWGRAPDGRSTRAGGWGYLLGDEGSGYDIAVRALRLATQTADGRASAPALLQAALDHWDLRAPEPLIGRVDRAETARPEIAALAQRIVALADAGEAAAAGLLEDAAGSLGQLVAAVARKLDLGTPPVALAGGLLGASQRLRRDIAACAGVEPEALTYVEEPAHGALVIARRLVEPDHVLRDG
jgi:N-acetylglucosamine kinase-like BadF-type ATPase